MNFRPSILVVAFACGGLSLTACSSDSGGDTAASAQTESAGGASTEATLVADGSSPAESAASDTGSATMKADDLCTVVPSPAAIEAAIGVSVKNPLGIGEPGSQQTCTFLRATDDFPGITLSVSPGATIAGKTKFVKTNFNIDIVPLAGFEGYYAGEGDSVYVERKGVLYQTSATIDGDSRAASQKLMEAWLAS